MCNRSIVERYLDEMSIALAENTIKSYRSTLSDFCAVVGAETPSRDSIITYIKELKSRGISNNSIRTKVSQIKSYFAWAVANGYYEKDSTNGIKLPATETHVTERMTRAEAKALLHMDAPRGTHNQARNKVMLELALVTATRVSALCALRRSDVDLEARTVRFEHTKRNKELVMPLTDHLASALEQYIHFVRPSDLANDDYLFVGERKDENGKWRPLTRQAVSVITKRYTEACCGRALSPHKLRHTSASIQIEAGLPIEDISKNLGHSSVSTTQRYAQKLSDGGRRAATVAAFDCL